jgi:hypothetical protein
MDYHRLTLQYFCYLLLSPWLSLGASKLIILHDTWQHIIELERIPSASTPSLRTLEEIPHNRIKLKKEEMHRTQNRRADITDRVWTEIETL